MRHRHTAALWAVLSLSVSPVWTEGRGSPGIGRRTLWLSLSGAGAVSQILSVGSLALTSNSCLPRDSGTRSLFLQSSCWYPGTAGSLGKYLMLFPDIFKWWGNEYPLVNRAFLLLYVQMQYLLYVSPSSSFALIRVSGNIIVKWRVASKNGCFCS